MPWTEWTIMDQQEQFVRDWVSGGVSEGGVMCGLWHQSANGGEMAGAVARTRGGGVSGPVAAAPPDPGGAGGGNHCDETPARFQTLLPTQPQSKTNRSHLLAVSLLACVRIRSKSLHR